MSGDSSRRAEPPDRNPGIESTVELIERARSGDRQAAEHLFTRHLTPLQRFARGRLPRWARDLADTDDLVQDTLLQTFKRMDVFESRHTGALQAYLRQAVLNRLRDEVRRKFRTPDKVDVAGVELDGGTSPLEQAIGRETLETYEKALGRLRSDEREAIIGRLEMGLTYDELALALDKPTPDAARKAAQRAILRLAQEMQRDR
jgi:RNA polymerase sigma-70 factor (ECF subfamily)